MADASSRNVEVVRGYLDRLQDIATTSRFPHFSPDFRMHSNGRTYDLEGFKQHFLHTAAMLVEAHFQVLDIFGWRDRVAVWRRVSPIATRDGTQQPAISIVDVWTVRDGLIVAGEQCWQRLAGPAADDNPISPKESLAGEGVRAALEGLQKLGCIQEHLHQHWAPDFTGSIDGVEMDLQALCRHWAGLQGLLSTVIVEVKDLLVHASSVGVVYHVFCGRRDRRLAELRVVAVYSVGADDKIRGCEAVSRLLSGGAGDELLASVGIA